jgi:hypothetical protein
MDLLVAFTNEQAAGDFVHSMEELFEEGDEIEATCSMATRCCSTCRPSTGCTSTRKVTMPS